MLQSHSEDQRENILKSQRKQLYPLPSASISSKGKKYFVWFLAVHLLAMNTCLVFCFLFFCPYWILGIQSYLLFLTQMYFPVNIGKSRLLEISFSFSQVPPAVPPELLVVTLVSWCIQELCFYCSLLSVQKHYV